MQGLFVKSILLAGTVACPIVTGAHAQGLAGAALEGTARRAGGGVVVGAAVSLRDSATGGLRTTVTDTGGRFRFENAGVGVYRLEVRAIGMSPLNVEGVRLNLGDRARLDVELAPAAQSLAEVIVRPGNLRDAGAGGPVQSIPRDAINGLMLLDRDFVGLFALSPQATGPNGLWVGGQHSRYNAIQVDGTSASDFFGVNITPGSSSGGRSIPLEAIQEVRLLIAPFDVRHGGFSGGLINALTRSGSNQLHASIFTSLSRSELVGEDSNGSSVPTFEQLQYGLSVGGPIVRDKLHYFGVAELQQKRTQFVGPSIDDPATGVTDATASRAAAAFRARFGFESGDARIPDLDEPTKNVLLKLSWRPSANRYVEVTPFFSRARSDQLNRQIRNLQNSDGWQLSNSGQIFRNSTSGVRIRTVATWGRATNEGVLSITSVGDRLDSRHRVPLFIVQADAPNAFLSAGSAKGSQGTETAHRIIEVSDNLTVALGNHLVTIGTQNWFVRVRDNFMSGAWGAWTFSNVDSLERGSPSRYEIALPLRDQPLSSYSSVISSVYLQDQWRPRENFRITAGVRIEAPYFESPQTNQQLLSTEAPGGIDTGDFPSGNLVVAPRLGFSLNIGPRRTALLRGGVGVFTGRPPLVWLTNAYANTGEDQALVVCTRAEGVPAPTADIGALPRQCTGGSSRSAANPSVTYFDSDFRFQRAVKYVLGLDMDLGDRWNVSADVGYTSTGDHITLTDRNLVDRGMNSEQRVMYGTITGAGESRPTRLDSTSFGAIYEFGNATVDRFQSASVLIRRDWSSGGLIQAGYTWSRTRDAMSAAGFSSLVSFRNNPIDGSLARRSLGRSARDIPHNFVGTAILPVGGGFTASLLLRASSGTPYAFTVNGDANADGAARNDLVYVPASADDIQLGNPETFADLDALIEKMPCLRSQRGAIMRRNSCRNPGITMLDARLSKRFSLSRSRGVEVSADVFNVPNLLNREWGQIRETTAREDVPLMIVTGWNAGANRPRYSVPQLNGIALLPPIDQVVADASRWRAQVGARYEF